MPNTSESVVPSDETMQDFSKLLFSVRVSFRYHRLRQRYWDTWSDFLSILSVVSGTGAFASVLAGLPTYFALGFSFLVAFLQAFDLVVGPSKRARVHSDLARQFLTLEQKSLLAEHGISDKNVTELALQKLSIEADEPPNKKWLLVHLNNELERVENGSASIPYHIPPMQRFFMSFFDFRDVTKASRIS